MPCCGEPMAREVDFCCPPPPMLTSMCNMTSCFRPNSICSATACCSPCIQPCGYLPAPRPLPATACVTVCSVCRPPECPQPCRLCPIVRCTKMLFVAPPQRRGFARYHPPTAALPKKPAGYPLRLLAPYGTRFQPPMKFSLGNCCNKLRLFPPPLPTPRPCVYSC